MRLLVHLVVKDLRRKARSPLGLVAALSFPLLFAGLLALAFGSGGGIPRVRMLVVNQDDGLLGGAVELLGRVLTGGPAIDGISIQPPSLNTLFLNLTGRELRD